MYLVIFYETSFGIISYLSIFFNEIKSQFVVSIRVLRSDKCREYLSCSFKQFMASHGILHQTSCAYTPQQNGVAEHKNRHLIETTRTLLIHGNSSPHYIALSYHRLSLLFYTSLSSLSSVSIPKNCP